MPCAPFILVATLLLILQTSFLPGLPGWFAKIDPLFVLVVFVSVRLDPYRGALLIIYIGMLTDIFSGIYSGLHPVIYLALHFMIKLLSRPLVLNEPPHQIPLVLASYIFVMGLTHMITTLLSPEAISLWSWKEIIVRLLLLALITMPLFSLYDYIMNRLSPKKALQILIKPGNKNRFRDDF
ncbi:MAG: rod shape-determining protein MreD [Desulfurivibrionaceae bacterium]|nr:rod shape-determining protein MreD [Desulfurivibrionaceae bacterium]